MHFFAVWVLTAGCFNKPPGPQFYVRVLGLVGVSVQAGARAADTEAICTSFFTETPCLQGLLLWWLLRREEDHFGLAAACLVSLQLKNRCQLREDGGGGRALGWVLLVMNVAQI